MATPRGRLLLQLLHARVRWHGQQVAAVAVPSRAQHPFFPQAPAWHHRRALSSGVGAGVSPGAATTSAMTGDGGSGGGGGPSRSFETNGAANGPMPPPPPPSSSSSSSSASAAADRAAAEWLYRRFRQRGGADLAFDVVQFFPAGTALEHHRPLSPAELELHPRDVGLFAPSPRLAAPQRATIAVHDDKILFRTEVARAIITADRAVLFKSTRRRGETGRMARAILSALQAPQGAAAVATAAAAPATQPPCPTLPQLPFELRVLEVLLDATADYFYRKTQHLNWMLEAVGGEEGAGGGGGGNGGGSSSGSSSGSGRDRSAWVASAALRGGPMAALARAEPFAAMDKAHQLVPVQRFLTGVKADVQETAKAIEALLEDPESLEELCLTHRRQQALASAAAGGPPTTTPPSSPPPTTPSPCPSIDARLASNMLESYLREIQSIEGALRETEENLENARQGWQIALDASRNHIIQANLTLSFISISVMAATLLPAALGMNLDSGLPTGDPVAFWGVCGASAAVAVLSFPLGRALYLRHWRKVAQQELFEQKMLRVLLMQHADELDDVVAALGQAHRAGHPIDKLRFRRILADALGTRAALSAGKADFLWSLFDSDRNGFLTEAEVLRRVTQGEADGRALPPEVAAGGGGDGLSGGGGSNGAAAALQTLATGAEPMVRRPPPRSSVAASGGS